jgi:diguanylate cyclase (GGDEF)-like protein
MLAYRSILLKSTAVTVLSIAVSLLLAITIVPALGGVVDGNAWLMCILCPLVIAYPASAWQFFQAMRLRRANAEIARLHRELEEAHRDLMASHGELAERARHDALTGLLNREGFFGALDEAVAGDPSGVLLMIDADHFKAINDQFGHPTGDRALRAIGDVIAGSVAADGLAGRIGGEEFAVYLRGAALEEAAEIAEQIRRSVSALDIETGNGAPVPLSVSVGCASRSVEGSLEALVAVADRQLYRAKRRGRNRVALPAKAKAAA